MLYYPWHQAALSFVEQQVINGRQPHATLFRLRNGFDDTALGWNMAKYLLCGVDGFDPQGKHSRLIDERAHPNVVFLDAANDKVGIDDVRDLEQQMWRTAMFDGPKVAYLQGIDALSISAQNALLKTLEEPPHNAYFILSAANISRVLPTIMSRVQRLQHANFTGDRLTDWLRTHGAQNMADAAIAKIVQLADGAPLPAQKLLASENAVRELTQEKAQFAEFVSGKATAAQLVERMDKDGVHQQLERYRRYTEHLIRFLFDKTAGRAEEGSHNVDEAVRYATWNGVNLRSLYQLHDALVQLRRLADTNVDMPLQLSTVLDQWHINNNH